MTNITNLSSNITNKSFDHVIANTPYFDRKTSVRSINLAKEKSFGETCPISDWLKVAAKRAKPKGFVHFIVRSDRLPEMFNNMPNSLGSLVITPILSRQNENAKLTILHAKKNGRAGFTISSPIILHPLKSDTKKSIFPKLIRCLELCKPNKPDLIHGFYEQWRKLA